MKTFVIKENSGFRLTVQTWLCAKREGLHTVEFVQESKNLFGEVDMSSTYQFFMTNEELITLANTLQQIAKEE
jgi:hypothetical protein